MAHKHMISPRGDHRPVTTAHLAQTMSLLEMSNNELAEKIQAELANNPALEAAERNNCPVCNRRLVNQLCPTCSNPLRSSDTDPIVFVSSRIRKLSGSGSSSYNQDFDSFENYTVDTVDLPYYVLNQIRTELKVDERSIAAAILHGLDDAGLFTTPPVELAMLYHVPISKIEHVRSLIQRCDPVGVASGSSREALLVQVDVLRDEGIAIPPKTREALANGFHELSHQNTRGLSKLLGISNLETETIIEFISENLNPFPAHAHWGNHRDQTKDQPERFHDPDIIISRNTIDPNSQLVVQILWPIYRNLYISPIFKKILAEKQNGNSDTLQKEHQKATLLIKCIAQRNHTLVLLMQKLAEEQRMFILNGDRYLKPMTRAQIAEDLGFHESTISRAVNNKSVQLPSGKIIPLAQFFDRSLPIRTILKEIIENEAKPLSDTKISSRLEQEGYNIARRTVAKYRAMEGILPAHMRKKLR